MESVSNPLLFGESPDALILLSSDGRIMDWNNGAQLVFGYSRIEATNALLQDLVVPPDHRADQQHQLQETLAGRKTTYESVRRRKDASLLYVDVTMQSTRSAQGELCVISAEKDVTTIKVMRDAKLMEARFRDLLESTPDGIVMANPTGHIVIANSQAERLFGYEPGELRGVSVDLLLPTRYRHAHVGHRSNYFQQPRTRAMGSGLDLAGLRKDGSEFPIEISLSPLRTEESAFVMSAIRDISERKRFEKALQEKNQELASANQAKDHFLAGMSHELRTPLNAIIGFTGTLLMKLPGPLNSEQEKQLRTVQSSGRHLLALINDLLDVSKIAAGKVDLAFEAVDCEDVLLEVEATLKPQAVAKGLNFDLVLPQQAVVLQTDRRALCQIVLNLTGNAIKFTEAGHVRLTLENPALEDVNALGIRIEDSGVGIPTEDIDRLFGAFTRINPARANAPEGTGLGLHLSQKLAELLGGRIVVHSESGHGSRFTLFVTKADAMLARILVIEDNAANLELVRFLLAYHGYTVLLAKDGPEGVAKALQERPALILCDLQMPGFDGYQVLRELRGKLDAVIVALTAFSMPNDRHNVLSAGFDGYMSKPIDPEKFVREIELYLPVDQRAPAVD